ncbi:cation:proton antiporter [Actinomadura sp. WMMB 499]|uniref:cation:proton antiporter n=1 Tax=Actinomadura sp. WMMB 499 TaxID=1219491 RepID=UPI0020C7D923
MHSTLQLIEIGAVILALGLLGAISNRFGISPIPLYLIAGLAFGTGGIYPLTTSEDFIAIGSEIGVILLLFTLGLEYTADELVGTLRTSAHIGLADLVLNAAPGVIVALILGWGPVAAVAMGGITYVTSSGITAKVMGDLGWLGNRETPAVLSVLVFEDLAMAVYLPILTALLAGAGLLSGSITLAIAAGTITVILIVALRFGSLVERFVHSPNEEVLLLKVLGLTMLVAGIAQQLQVSAAVGAFLVGIALSGTLAHEAQKLLAPLRDLFAAVFFVFFGLHTDPGDLPRSCSSRPSSPSPASPPSSAADGSPPATPESPSPDASAPDPHWSPAANSTSSSPAWPSAPESTPNSAPSPPPTS